MGTGRAKFGRAVTRRDNLNCLVFFPHEIQTSATEHSAVLKGQRAQHALELHGVKPGVRIKAAILGAKIGFAEVRQASADELNFEIECEQDPPKKLAIHLIAAVPRPHLVRKTLQFAAMSGVARLTFICSDKVVPGYLQSKSLRRDQIELQILNGLEQAIDCIAPLVEVYALPQKFWHEVIPSQLEQGTVRWGDTFAQNCSPLTNNFDHLTLCFGPEAGWSEQERRKFIQLGIEPFSLGPRMLRLDVALAVALGAVAL